MGKPEFVMWLCQEGGIIWGCMLARKLETHCDPTLHTQSSHHYQSCTLLVSPYTSFSIFDYRTLWDCRSAVVVFCKVSIHLRPFSGRGIDLVHCCCIGIRSVP